MVNMPVKINKASTVSKRKYTDEQFIAAVSDSKSVAEVFNHLKLIPAGGNYKSFYKKIKELNLSTAHFTGQGHLKGKSHNWTPKIPLDEILVENSFYKTSALRERLISELNWINQCSICFISSWQDKTLVLHLDHINGINTDNRISNLRLLCPNCHSQTETYCVKK